MRATSVIGASLALLVGCSGGAVEDAGTNESQVALGGALPVVQGDSTWLECNDGALALSLWQRPGPDGASRSTTAQLLHGESVLTGTIDDRGGADFRGSSNAFGGRATIDLAANIVVLDGVATFSGTSSAVKKTLSCNRLGADFRKTRPVPAVFQGHGDSTWLVCDGPTLVANILEHRGPTGQGRVLSMTLITGGGTVVSGVVDEEDNATALTGAGGTSASFRGTASVDFSAPSVALAGGFRIGDTRFDVGETVSCKQLFVDF